MHSSFFKPILYFFILIFAIIFFSSISIMNISLASANLDTNSYFVWPLPGYTYISSYFGYRFSPTAGASTYHSGIDIPAPNGTPIVSVISGIVTFCSWGAGRRVYNCYRERRP